jgi:chromosome segregation ATPase
MEPLIDSLSQTRDFEQASREVESFLLAEARAIQRFISERNEYREKATELERELTSLRTEVADLRASNEGFRSQIHKVSEEYIRLSSTFLDDLNNVGTLIQSVMQTVEPGKQEPSSEPIKFPGFLYREPSSPKDAA